MSNTFEAVLAEYEKQKQPSNRLIPFHMDAAQFNIVKQLIRMELSNLIEADANNKVIDQLTRLDAELITQYEQHLFSQQQYEEDGLPF